MEDLSKFRKEIDKLDKELIEIIKQRLIICKKLGDFKMKNGLRVRDRKREKQIIADKIEKSSLDSRFIKKLFKLIMKESRRLQKEW
jgi:chorismate mutase